MSGKNSPHSLAWIIPSITAIVFFVVFIWLGRWQLDRAQEKESMFANFDEEQSTMAEYGPVSNERAISGRYQRRRVFGHYDSRHQFLLDNMVNDGRIGFQILTPFVMPDRPEALLVNRGWVPLTGSRQNIPFLPVTEIQREITGLIDMLPRAGYRAGPGIDPADETWPRLAQFPTSAELASVLEYPLFDYILLLDASEPDGYLREWRPNVMSVERHRGYAVQWFAMAATVLFLFAILSWKYWNRRSKK